MGKDTLISWCDSTVNPNTGCDGCELWEWLDALRERKAGPCYAGNYHEIRMAKALPNLYAARFGEVRMIPGRMAKAAAWSDMRGVKRPGKPWLDGMPRVIFVGDMGDILSAAVTFDFLKAELVDNALSPKGSRHIWMVLTKRPARLVKFAAWLRETFGIRWPDNIWVGTSVTTRKSLKRVDTLVCHPAAVRFISAEPLREEISLAPWIGPEMWGGDEYSPIRLVIVGGESDQGEHKAHPFHVEWGLRLMSECDEGGVSFHWKQMGSHLIDRHGERIRLKDSHGGDWDEWPEDLRVREFPKPRLEPARA